MTYEHLKEHIRDIPDFPEPGVLYRDITPLLLHPPAYRELIDAFKARYKELAIRKIVAVESRGFLFASTLCYELGAGFVPTRKVGKLPYQTISQSYSLEYGEATLEIHTDAVDKGDRVLIFDDLLATGGTASAAVTLVRQLGGEVVEAGFVIELLALHGRDRMDGTPVFSLLQY